MTATPASPTGVTLLWLEPTRSGSAARTHLDGTRQRLRASGISVLTTITSEARGSNPVARARRLLSLVRQARARANGGVLVARWHPFLAFVSPLWLRRRGQVLLLVQGNDESAYEANPWLRRVPGARKLMQTSVVTASRIIVVTEGLIPWVQASISRAATTERFGTTIEVMPTGVADVFFDTAPREGLGEYVLYFGSLAPWQGIDYMLEAHASSEWPAGLKLIVIGGGVKQAAVEQAQGDSLQWLGPLEPAEVAAYAAGAICTLCTKSNAGSMSEVTVPFKILESVAAGVPVVATDIPAQVAMLAAGFGLLASAEHPADLAKAVASIHADAGLRESLAVRAREAAPTLRWESAAPQLAAAIRALAISHDPVARG